VPHPFEKEKKEEKEQGKHEMKMVPAPPPMTSSPIMSSSSHQQFQVTEDTPVDFLEGCMEILVVFPNEKSILMSIQRRYVCFTCLT